MIVRLCMALLTILALCPSPSMAKADGLIVDAATRGSFPLARLGQVTSILRDPDDHGVIAHAADDLADDIRAVTGTRPVVATAITSAIRKPVIIGTLGKNRLIDQIVATGKLDVTRLRGAWESFLIATVDRPLPGIDQALVIVGSDRRGAAFGAYELSEAMGVSPWVWWADVTPRHRDTLSVARGGRQFGPPSVRYRGLFLNDEDWGLFPWAARTFDPQKGNIGPKSYERVFNLLLRLKANSLWPAMHKVSAPFNADPANAKLADDHGIIMGSSHAEPMLRNNVGEWKQAADAFDYAANPAGVHAYWEERVRSNAQYESLWTLGMRGIHDSGIVGANSTTERVALLNRIIADQRALLHDHVRADIDTIPQMFVPYKEVLDIYRAGLTVPDDVTIVWPDDNFGYIRQFPSEAESKRAGGTGIYYHLSYLGAPLSYLWLNSTPPALIQEEMTRAYDRGARSIWIANVGDIKPAEIGITLFLEMAWDIDRWRGTSQRAFLNDWAGRTLGAEQSTAIGEILDTYFRLNFERRPEHLQWWLPGQKARQSNLSPQAVDARLARFKTLVEATRTVASAIPADLSDAYFELVDYPVRAAAAANLRTFAAERYAKLIDNRPEDARLAAGIAATADREVKSLTDRFNTEIAGGKWRYIMAEEPADNQWTSYRTVPIALPTAGMRQEGATVLPALAANANDMTIEAEDFTSNRGWRLVDGLGRGKGVMVASPDAALSFTITIPAGESRPLLLGLLPLYPDAGDGALHLDVAVDGGTAVRVNIPRETGSPDWAQGVLDNRLRVATPISLTPGRHRVHIISRSSGLALDQLLLSPANIP